MGSRALAVFTVVAAGVAVPAAAQTKEIAPFDVTLMAGYRFGGGFRVSGEALEVKDSVAFGVSGALEIADDGEIELLYARQPTRLTTGGFFTSEPRFDLAVEYYQLGGNYLFGEVKDRLRGYLGMTLGLTRLIPEPANLETETRFSGSFVLGAKAHLARRFGLRFEGRMFVTVLASNGSVFCGSQSGCLITSTASAMTQGEIRGGVFFRF